MLISATYVRQFDSGRDEPLSLTAEVIQDSGAGFNSELCVVWTDESLATLAAAGLNYEELVGAGEAIEEKFWSLEAEACRVSKVQQQLGATEAA